MVQIKLELRDVHLLQRNIDAVTRAIDGKPQSLDFIPLADTLSLLIGIRDQLLPEYPRPELLNKIGRCPDCENQTILDQGVCMWCGFTLEGDS